MSAVICLPPACKFTGVLLLSAHHSNPNSHFKNLHPPPLLSPNHRIVPCPMLNILAHLLIPFLFYMLLIHVFKILSFLFGVLSLFIYLSFSLSPHPHPFSPLSLSFPASFLLSNPLSSAISSSFYLHPSICRSMALIRHHKPWSWATLLRHYLPFILDGRNSQWPGTGFLLKA